MASYRLAWFLIICLINERSAHDKVSSRVVGSAVNIGKEVLDKGFNLLTTSCQIQIVNKSSYKLVKILSLHLHGDLEGLKPDIDPHTTEIIKARAGIMKVMGTSGIISWKIEGKNIRLVVMWRLNVFKATNSQKNTLWIALTPAESFDIGYWKKFVTKNVESTDEFNNLNIKKGIFTTGKPIEELKIKSSPFIAKGIMEAGKTPTAIITLTSE